MSSLRPDDHRRKWDRAQYERLAQDRLTKNQKTDTDDEGNKIIIIFG